MLDDFVRMPSVESEHCGRPKAEAREKGGEVEAGARQATKP
jgi:hypothetical protein